MKKYNFRMNRLITIKFLFKFRIFLAQSDWYTILCQFCFKIYRPFFWNLNIYFLKNYWKFHKVLKFLTIRLLLWSILIKKSKNCRVLTKNYKFFLVKRLQIMAHTAVITIKHVSTFVNKVENPYVAMRIFDLIDKCRYVFYGYDGSILEYKAKTTHTTMSIKERYFIT